MTFDSGCPGRFRGAARSAARAVADPAQRRAELQEQQSADARTWPSSANSARPAGSPRHAGRIRARQEGLGVGVREILSLAKEAAGPWTRPGHVVELLEVDSENAAAVGSCGQAVGPSSSSSTTAGRWSIILRRGQPDRRGIGFLTVGSPADGAGAALLAGSRPLRRTRPHGARASSAAPTASSARPPEFIAFPSGSWPTWIVASLGSPGNWPRRPATPAASSPCRENC